MYRPSQVLHSTPLVVILGLLVAIMTVSAASATGQDQEETKSASAVHESEEIVVTGTRSETLLIDAPVRTEVLGSLEIERSGAANLYDLFDKHLIPNVWVETSCTNCNFSSVRMQGLEGGYSMILVDGQPIYSALASVYGLRQIMSSGVERVEIVKGSGSALYGSAAIGGVINVITRDPARGESEGAVTLTVGEYGTVDVGANASLRHDDLAVAVGVQRLQTDFADETGADGEPDEYTDRVERNNIATNMKLHWFFDDDMQRVTVFGRHLHEFRRGGYLGMREREIDTDDDGLPDRTVRIPAIDDPLDPDAEHITTDRSEFGWSYRGDYSGGRSLRFIMTGTHHERDATNGARPFSSEEDLLACDLQYSTYASSAHFVTAGLSYRGETLDQRINWEEAPRTEADVYGVFAQDEWDLSDNLELVLGARFDRTESTLVEDEGVSPRAGLKWKTSDALTLRASVGGGFRVPYLFAEDLHLCSAAPTIVVDPAIEPEKSWNANVSGSVYLDRFSADLSLFRTKIRDKIALDFVEGSPDYDAIYRNAGDAVTQGVEANVRYQFIDALALTSGFAWTDAQYDTPLDPAVPESDHVMRVPEIAMTVGFEVDDTARGLTIDINARMTGSMYLEKELLLDIGGQGAGYHVDHTDPFWVMDLRAEKSVLSGDLTLFTGVENIFDETQDVVYNAEQEDTAAYIYAPLTGRYLYGGARVRF